MEDSLSLSRQLDPHAPPFYPSKFHHRTGHLHRRNRPPPPPYQTLRPPPSTTIFNQKKTLRFPLTPIPKGPRNIKPCWTPRRRSPPATAVDDGGKKYREVIRLKPEDNATSVMIRNIPNNYTRTLLVEFLDKHCRLENAKAGNTTRSAFDFVYLPVDFKHRLNAGYAFVNFTTSEAAWKFHSSVKGKHWVLFQSRKIADVTRARIQGKDALVRNFERMKLCSPLAEYLPVWFEPARDGSKLPSVAVKMHTIGVLTSRRT
ncbi:hypothetical protein QVD17_21731 [Tagetes erecta]|uniref:Mei2-like C-terminal RNA recognition motif domain-containing protein n=1 Tax=Tagetes erecta TaxID=13708 RepID=A0AAD8KCA7_TARER|nr:hypothetical protein QVD17_21731 [Tagetes erecta]